jgi:hypothetical protein
MRAYTTALTKNDNEGKRNQEGGSMGLNQKGNDAGYHVSGFFSEQQGIIVITQEQLDPHVASLPNDEARGEVLRASEFNDIKFTHMLSRDSRCPFGQVGIRKQMLGRSRSNFRQIVGVCTERKRHGFFVTGS